MKTVIPARKQSVWGWPAVVNFSLGGIGTGLYVIGALLVRHGGGGTEAVTLLKLGGPALVGVGLLTLTAEAGRPLRGANLLRNLGRSWMAREAVAAALFMMVAALDRFFPHPLLFAVALTAALVLMISQGFILFGARGVTAWNVGLLPALFVSGGLVGGYGLTTLLAGLGLVRLVEPWVLCGWVLAAANLALWLVYLYLPGEDFRSATRLLRTPYWLGLLGGAGHLLPVLLLTGTTGAGGMRPALLLTLAGAGLLLGSLLPKVGIVQEAGYLRPIRLVSGSLTASPKRMEGARRCN